MCIVDRSKCTKGKKEEKRQNLNGQNRKVFSPGHEYGSSVLNITNIVWCNNEKGWSVNDMSYLITPKLRISS